MKKYGQKPAGTRFLSVAYQACNLVLVRVGLGYVLFVSTFLSERADIWKRK